MALFVKEDKTQKSDDVLGTATSSVSGLNSSNTRPQRWSPASANGWQSWRNSCTDSSATDRIEGKRMVATTVKKTRFGPSPSSNRHLMAPAVTERNSRSPL